MASFVVLMIAFMAVSYTHLVGGILAEECQAVLADFFARLRGKAGHAKILYESEEI